MAAIALLADVIDRVTLANPPGTLQEIALDERVRYLEIQGYNAVGTARDEVYVQLSGVDGGAMGADYETILATELAPRRFTFARRARRLGGFSIYLASDTAAAICEIRTSSREP